MTSRAIYFNNNFRDKKIIYTLKKHRQPSDPTGSHWYTCMEGSENNVGVWTFFSKKFDIWVLFL